MSSGNAIAMDSHDVRAFVTEKLSQAKRSEYYALLGIEKDADDHTIRDAYRDLLTQLEDRALKRAECADLWLPVQRIQRELARAYSVLTDPHRRAGYDRRDGASTSWPPRQQWSAAAAVRMNGVGSTAVAHISGVRHRIEEPTGRASTLHARARTAATAQHYERAQQLLEEASVLEPENPNHMRELGWFIFLDRERLTPERMRRARDLLQDACINAPWDAVTRYRMAQFWRETGNALRYRLELQATLRCDHEHVEAAKELAAIGDLQAEEHIEDASAWGRFWRRLSKNQT